MKRRKFGFAIRLLESYIANYKGSFEYYLALGTSCLYIGDEGDAAKYYQLAREIHINSSELLLGQAALLLRHGNTVKALQYYMDILDIDPNNEQANSSGQREKITRTSRESRKTGRLSSSILRSDSIQTSSATVCSWPCFFVLEFSWE